MLAQPELLQLVDDVGGTIEDWRLARRLRCGTRDLAERLEPIVAAGHLRRFHNKVSMPCYGLTDEGREALGKAQRGVGAA